MGRKANERIQMSTKCHCGKAGRHIGVNGKMCREHYDELVKVGSVIPPSHYETMDGYKVVEMFNGQAEEVGMFEGKKLFLWDTTYQLVKT